MEWHFDLEPHDTLVVHLHDGDQRASMAVTPSRAGLLSLRRALDAAFAEGYGECFWPAFSGGQYWWMFKRDAERLEVIAMWTRGGASLWEHVFRASDAASWMDERLRDETARLEK